MSSWIDFISHFVVSISALKIMRYKFYSMLHLIISLTAVVIIISSTPLLAQERITIGLGVGLNTAIFLGDAKTEFQPAGVATWYVPIQIGAHLRVEPEIGYAHTYTFYEDNSTRDAEVNRSFLRIGTGVFYAWKADSTLRIYAGVRTGILSTSLEQNYIVRLSGQVSDEYKENQASFYYAGAIGGEWLATQHFSIGAELQFAHYAVGIVESRTPTLVYPRNQQYSVFTTQALIGVRFYF